MGIVSLSPGNISILRPVKEAESVFSAPALHSASLGILGQGLPPHNTQLSPGPGCGVLLRCLHMPLTTVSGISLSMILLCSQSEACESHKANDSAAIFKPRDRMVSSGVVRPSTQTIHFQTTQTGSSTKRSGKVQDPFLYPTQRHSYFDT